MEIISERIRKLRKDLGISQEKIGKMLGAKQASINSYEHSKSAIPTKVLLWYAEFFDVSLDYIFGRTDNPRGMECKFKPKPFIEIAKQNEKLKDFIEMCFEPGTIANKRLKASLFKILTEEDKSEWTL